MDKYALRAMMRERLSAISSPNRQRNAAKACTALKLTLPWRNARSLLVFLSAGDEIDTAPVLEAAFAEGKAVFAPRVHDESLDFIPLDSAEGPFIIEDFGIRVPAGKGRPWNSLASPGPAIVLVPGLAFDETGGRLGRGGGYYDRFIATLRLEARASGEIAPQCLGYGHEVQVIGRLTLEGHDEVLDGVVTDRGGRLV